MWTSYGLCSCCTFWMNCVSGQSLSRALRSQVLQVNFLIRGNKGKKGNPSQVTDDLTNRYQMPYRYKISPLSFYNDILQCLISKLQFEYPFKVLGCMYE